MPTFHAIVGRLVIVALLTGSGHLAVAGQEHAVPGEAGRFTHVHALALDATGHVLWLGAHTGLFRSEDGGRSWQKAPLRVLEEPLDLMAIAPHPGDAQTLYVGTHEAGVLKSTDGGRTWQPANAGLGGLDVHGLAVDPATPEKLHAAVRDTGEGLYRTTDAGMKWTRVDDGPGGEVKMLASVNIPTGMGGDLAVCGHRNGLAADPGLLLRMDTSGRSARQSDGERGRPATMTDLGILGGR
jgi:photosystem II stability/assembly factor-like uncharacterized protein